MRKNHTHSREERDKENIGSKQQHFEYYILNLVDAQCEFNWTVTSINYNLVIGACS